jgi:hypothetical protein
MAKTKYAIAISALLATASPCEAGIVTIDCSADAYIRTGNSNFGSETLLRLRRTGTHRSLVRFDDAEIDAAVAGGTLLSATLELFIEANGGSWSAGRPVDAHRLLAEWSERSVTFNCPDDADPSNGSADCPTPWNGGTFAISPTDSYTQTNDLSGTVELDVTADVAAFLGGSDNYGWLVKKRDEGQNGLVDFTAREGAGSQHPRLVLDVFVPPTETPTNTPTVSPTPTPTATPIDTQTPTATPSPDLDCGAEPLHGCRQSIQENKSLLLLKDRGGPSDKLVFKWTNGESTDASTFGNPVDTTSYTLCVYDESAGIPSLAMQAIVPAGGSCAGKPCWKSTRKGFRFKDRLLLNDGIKVVNVVAGPSGKAKIIVKGKGSNLDLPSLPLHQQTRVIAQIKNDAAGGQCWEARFSGPPRKNSADAFKDKGDPPTTIVPTASPTETAIVSTESPTPVTPSATPSVTATAGSSPSATSSPTGPTATPTPTDTPGGSNCGNGFLEPGEFFGDPTFGLVGDPGGIECPQDAQVAACTPLGSLDVDVDLIPPVGTLPTSATILVGYRSDLAALPAAAGGSAAARVTWPSPLPFIRNAIDFDYAVRVITIRSDGPIDSEVPIFSVVFDTCSGRPAPDPSLDLGCIVEGCSGAGGPINGCTCAVH